MFAIILSLLVLMLVGSHVHSNEGDDEKIRKRRIQNSNAAKKSYQNKKKERQQLLQKNTQLVEAQKKLLRDNSHLQERIKLLGRIADRIQHACTSSKREQDETSQTEASTNNISVIQKRSSCDSSSVALDLSVKSSKPLENSSSPTQASKVKEHRDIKYFPLMNSSCSSDGEYDLGVSRMMISVNKYGLTSVAGGKAVIERENGIFIPIV